MIDVYLYPWEFDSIPTYNASLPTGQTPGKTWKTQTPEGWHLRMYGDHFTPVKGGPSYTPIHAFRIHIRQGPAPSIYRHPDWHNTQHFNYPWKNPHGFV